MKTDREDTKEENQGDLDNLKNVDKEDKKKPEDLDPESFFAIDLDSNNTVDDKETGWSFSNIVSGMFQKVCNALAQPDIPDKKTEILPNQKQFNNNSLKDNRIENFNPHFKISSNELKRIEQINSGVQGVVCLAHWRHTPVAVKYMLTSNMTKDSRNLFFQEIKIMAQLRHPNIVQFIGVVGESTKGLAIVMEYMSEGTLSTLLKNRAIEINWERGCRLSLGIAHALAFLHYTTLHRDVKSPNIFVTKDWSTKLGDFGLSVVPSRERIGLYKVVGTPYWMAPELLRGGLSTTKSDIWSVGVVFNEIATRKSPFSDVQNFEALLQKHEVLSKGDDIPQETPETYKNLILHCWNTVSEKRPEAQDIVLNLEKFETELKEQKETNKIIRFPND